MATLGGLTELGKSCFPPLHSIWELGLGRWCSMGSWRPGQGGAWEVEPSMVGLSFLCPRALSTHSQWHLQMPLLPRAHSWGGTSLAGAFENATVVLSCLCSHKLWACRSSGICKCVNTALETLTIYVVFATVERRFIVIFRVFSLVIVLANTLWQRKIFCTLAT